MGFMRKGVEIEAPFSYLSPLCLTTPGLLVLLLLPMVLATPNIRGEHWEDREYMPGSGFYHQQRREGRIFFK